MLVIDRKAEIRKDLLSPKSVCISFYFSFYADEHLPGYVFGEAVRTFKIIFFLKKFLGKVEIMELFFQNVYLYFLGCSTPLVGPEVMELTGCGHWWGWREEGEEEESQNELSGFFLEI